MTESPWISVEDALPDKDNCWVIVYAKGAVNCMAYYNGYWTDWTNATNHNIHVEFISHWMPIPQMPEELDEE